MKRCGISMRRVLFVLVLGVLPLSALVCDRSAPRLEGVEAATPTPTPSASTTTDAHYSLEVSWAGSYTLPNGLITSTYGPDTVTIPLESSGSTFTGSVDAVWHASASGLCTATGSPAVTFDVTATQIASGNLDFSVNRSIVWTWDTQCPGVSGGVTSSNQNTYAFTLPSEDGASRTFSVGGPIWTFVLRKQ